MCHAQRAKGPENIDGSALPAAGAQRPQPRSGPGAPTTLTNLSGNTNVREVSFIGREGKAELWEVESFLEVRAVAAGAQLHLGHSDSCTALRLSLSRLVKEKQMLP